MITDEQTLNASLLTKLTIFFNVSSIKGCNVYHVVSSYRKSKYSNVDPSVTYTETASRLTGELGIPFASDGVRQICMISPRVTISLDDYRERLYKSIIADVFSANADNDDLDAQIGFAMFILRGSVDFNRKYYSVDLLEVTPTYIDEVYKIALSGSSIIDSLNLNFRELQPEYFRGENKRNTQLRVNLRWYYDNVISRYPDVNRYKTLILHDNIEKIGQLNANAGETFIDRIKVYRKSVLGCDLSDAEIAQLKDALFGKRTEAHRNQRIVAYAREILPDECASCRDKYDISDRSFIMPRTGRYYFEIHHVIPYATDAKHVDVIDDLVKLCPTCHRALTPGRAEKSLQFQIIRKIIESREEVRQFVDTIKARSANAVNESPVEYVYSILK